MQARRCRSRRVIGLLVCLQVLGRLGMPPYVVAEDNARREDPAKISLRYDPKLEALGFHSPILEASVAGQDAFFLIDTGASVHTFARWFAEAAGLDLQTTDSTVSGSTNKTSQIEVARDVSLRLSGSGQSLHLYEAIVVDFPPIFRLHRIGGLLSPQLLAPEGNSTLIDMHVPQINFTRGKSVHHGRSCINVKSQFKNRLYAIRVQVGDKKADMLVDSGATSTLLSNKSLAGKSLLGRASGAGHMEGVGGAPSVTQKIDDVTIKIGRTSLPSSLSLAEISPACGADGILGMDVLGKCVIELSSEGINLSCSERNNQGEHREDQKD